MAVCDTTNTIKKIWSLFYKWTKLDNLTSHITYIINSKIVNTFFVERGAKRGQILEIPEHY